MPRTELLLGIPNLLAGDSLDHMHFQNKNTAPLDTPDWTKKFYRSINIVDR